MGKTRQLITVLPSRSLDPDLIIKARKPEAWQNSVDFNRYLARLAGFDRTNVCWPVQELLNLRRWGADDQAMANLAPLMIDSSINGSGFERAHTILAWYRETLSYLVCRAGLENGPINQVADQVEKETEQLFGTYDRLLKQGFDQYSMVLANTTSDLVNSAVDELGHDPVDVTRRAFVSAIALGNRRSGYEDLPEAMQERVDCLIGDLVQDRP
jgi:hypothetical protein